MQNEIVKFNYGALEVRTVMIDGEPWFVASDVCRNIGLEWQGSTSMRPLDQDEKQRVFIPTDGGRQQIYVVSESGLYTLVMRSRKKEAVEFRRWVTHEVLPTIRKTGGVYMTEQKTEELLADPALIIGLAMQVKALKAERDEAIRTKAHVAKGREGTLMSNDEIAKAQQAGLFAGLKMSSREIAELTGKKYFHVKRDIEVLMNQGAINASNIGFNDYKVKVGFGYRTEQEYMLDFKATMVLTTGYDSVRWAAVIDRWMELEEIVAVKPAAPQFTIPQTMAEALRLAADLSEACSIAREENVRLTKQAEVAEKTKVRTSHKKTASATVKKMKKLEKSNN